MKKKGIPIYYVFIVLVFITSIYIATEQISDNDIWWHLKTGEYILENSIPTKDIFSFYGIENNFNWIAHEWLSEVVLYIFFMFFDFNGLIFFPILTLLITLIILIIQYKEYIKSKSLYSLLWFFVVGFILALFSSTRPHMFSFILFVATFFVIDLCKKKKHYVLLFPLISVLWVNLHGGSSSLLFVLIMFKIISNMFNFSFGRIVAIKENTQYIKILLMGFILSLFATIINPFYYKIVLYPLINMMDKNMLKAITEWQSPNFHNLEGIIVFIVISIPILSLLISNKKVSLYELLIVGSFSLLALRSIRQISYFAIAVTPVILNHLPYYSVREITKKNTIINAIIIVILISICFTNIYTIALNPIDISEYPSEQTLEKIKKYSPNRLFNDYNWGGYLIWKLYDSDINVFIDGRADIFSKNILVDYDYIYNTRLGWEQSFSKYDFDSILIPSNHILLNLLDTNTEWEVIHQDNISTFLVKKQD